MFKFLVVSVLAFGLIISSVELHAGGFDSSNRPFDIIFGHDNAVELSVSYIKPSVTVDISRNAGEGRLLPSVRHHSIVEEYVEPRIALRVHINERINCAFQLERPFHFKTMYPDDALSYQFDSTQMASQVPAPVNSEYSSESFTTACRFSYEINHDSAWLKHSYFSLIAGPKIQQMEGAFSSDLTNYGLSSSDNYRAKLNGSREWGYLLGLAYEIPSIAFRASLFFHNEIHHTISGYVKAPLPSFSGSVSVPAKSTTLTPKALNFRLQSGITDDWLAFMELRWGDWSSLNKMSVEAKHLSSELVLFQNDTLNYKVGLGVKVNERVSVGGYFESIVDINPPNTPAGVDGKNLRNPQGDRYSLALGGKYALTHAITLALGGSYYYIESGRFVNDDYRVELERSEALAFSGTLTYVF